MKKLQRIMLAGVFSVLGLSVAQADGPTVSGYIDTQYNYNLDKPFTGRTNLRSYDADDNTMSLNTAHLNFNGSLGDNLTYTIETDYGTDALVNTSAGHGTGDDFDVQEAYFVYTSMVALKIGKFVTPEGIEVIESKDNPTITRGFLFGLAEPFTHTGFIISKAFGKLDIGVGAVNGWDQAADVNEGKTFLGKIGLNLGDPLAVTITGYHGPEQASVYSTGLSSDTMHATANRSTIDLTAVTKLIPRTALWFQLNYGQEKDAVDTDSDGIGNSLATWGGATIQPVISITEKLSLGARWEVFEDPDGVRTGTGMTNVSVRNITITPGYKVTDNFTFRLEYRMDESNKEIWVDDTDTPQDSTSTVGAQAILTF